MSSIVERLTEGVVNRDMRAESHALLSKWKKTGLLEGLESERQQNTMSRLLENQAKELLRESSSMAAGDVQGFAAVAFPIVRRVFAGPYRQRPRKRSANEPPQWSHFLPRFQVLW